jgi:hypothetical protein
VSERIRRVSPATALMGGATLLSAGLLIHWFSRITFWRDEWNFLLHRTGWNPNVFLDPFVEQLLAIPVLIYRVLLSVFGMDSALPFQLVAVFLFALSVVMLFVYVRSRASEWVALAACLPILFLGPSWDDLLFAFQMALFGSVACGIGALLALERRDRAGDIAAMALLVGSLFFFDLGVAFVAGATVEIAFGRDRFRRAWVVAVPTLLWLIWYAGWGHTAETFVSFHNFTQTPRYVLDGLASSIATLLGLGSVDFQAPRSPLDWGRPLLIVALAAAGWRLYVLRRITPRLAAVAVILLGFWFLSGLNTNPLSPPSVGRYQYLGIVLLVLVAAELLRGVALSRLATGIVVFVGFAAALSNAPELNDAAKGIAGLAQQERGGLAALELTRDRVDPGLTLTEENSDVNYLLEVTAGSYLAAVDAHGSPAYTAAELETASEPARVAADKVFGAALRVGLRPATGVSEQDCSRGRAVESPTTIPVPAVGLVLRADGDAVQVGLRRYASDTFPLTLGQLPAGRPELLQIPADRSSKPWTVGLTGPGRVSICGQGAE